MDNSQIISIVTGVLEGGGLAVLFWFLIKGLKSEVKSLNSTIGNQQKTLEVMERRIAETEKIGDIYRKLLSELPDDMEQYKTFVKTTKDEIILELQDIVNTKDKEKKQLQEAFFGETQKLLKEQGDYVKESLNQFSELSNFIENTLKQIEEQGVTVLEIKHDLEKILIQNEAEIERYKEKCGYEFNNYREFLDAIEELKGNLFKYFPNIPLPIALIIHKYANELLNKIWDSEGTDNKEKFINLMNAINEDILHASNEDNRDNLPLKTIAIIKKNNDK